MKIYVRLHDGNYELDTVGGRGFTMSIEGEETSRPIKIKSQHLITVGDVVAVNGLTKNVVVTAVSGVTEEN